MIKKIVQFTELDAHCKNSFFWWLRKNIIVEPVVTHLKEVPTHFWKRSGNQILEMTRPEKIKRLKEIINKSKEIK